MLNFEEILSNYSVECYKDENDIDNIINFNNAKHRKLFLNEICDGIGSAIDAMIRFYNQIDDEAGIKPEDREPIKIYIDSPGGNISDTFTMIDSIKMSKTPVWGIVTGLACSGGFFTLLACHKRIGYKHSSYLYHEGSASNGGTANQFANFATYYKKELDMLKEHTLANTNISEELYEDKRRDDWWMTSDEALENGVLDEIAEELI